jgi:hypothetical protein
VAISALMRILEDKSLQAHHQMVCERMAFFCVQSYEVKAEEIKIKEKLER